VKYDIDTIVIAVGGQGRRIANDLRKREIMASKVFLKLYEKPVLGHLIDLSLVLNFQRIFLLSSYYENELRSYLRRNYSNNRQIIPIYGGRTGRRWGVPWLLHSIRQRLQGPFIYSDGNILYSPSILKKIKNIEALRSALANIVLSTKDLAPTHSRVILRKGRINEIHTRLQWPDKGTGNHSRGKQYYSLGLMSLSESIFSSVPRFAYRKDLDYVISDVFKSKKDLVRWTIYKGDWIAIHTIQDVDNLAIKS